MKISGNTILITGGGSGIGEGLAKAFAARDNQVVIAGRNEDRLKEVSASNPGIEDLPVDITDPKAIESFAEVIIEKFPTLNVLVNNAGIMISEDVLAHDLLVAEKIVATNLLGPIRLTSALIPHFLKFGSGSIINVTSGLAFIPKIHFPTYSASKAALHSYSISLREQLRSSGIEVVEIAPPYVRTYLTGEKQASDPNAMPLDEYVLESIKILESEEGIEEVLVERVKPLRFAEASGNFQHILAQLTEQGKNQ